MTLHTALLALSLAESLYHRASWSEAAVALNRVRDLRETVANLRAGR